MDRNTILAEKVQKEDNSENKKLFLILDYNPSLPPIKEWLNGQFYIKVLQLEFW